MPYKIKKVCSSPCCSEVTNSRFCNKHKKEYERSRGNASERGYTHRWRTASKRYLKEHPLCVECLSHKKYTPATVVDHKVPHRGDMVLFWDESNWQSLCKRCHDIKTATSDRYFEYT